MSAPTQVIAGIDVNLPAAAADLSAHITEDELALRRATAKTYLHGFQFLLAQARLDRKSFQADQLDAQFLQHVDKGKLMRQSVPVYAHLRRMTEAKAQNFLLVAVNLIQHAPELIDQLYRGQLPLEQVRAAGEKLRSIAPPRPDQDWAGQPWQEGGYADAVARTRTAKNDLGAQLQELAAPEMPETEFTAKAAELRDAHHPEDAAARHRAARAKRCVRISPAADGMANLKAHITTDDAANIQQILASAAQQGTAGDPRTLTQRQADLFVEALRAIGHARHEAVDARPAAPATEDRRSPAVQPPLPPFANGASPADGDQHRRCGRPPRAPKRIFAYLMLSLDQWLGLGGTLQAGHFDFLNARPTAQPETRRTTRDQPSAELIGQQQRLSPAELARLIGQVSTLQAVITHPASGYPIGLSVRTRRPAPRIRDLLLLRDQHCRFPGCRVPGLHCEVDHVNDFALGGTSELYGLALLCKKHHGGKSAGWWQVKLRPDLGDGALEFHFPQTGQTDITHPPLPLDEDAWERIRTELETPPF